MENVPQSVFFKDKESRFIAINTICAQKFGLQNPEDAIGKSDYDFFEEEHASAAFADEAQIMRTLKPIIDKEEREVFNNQEQTVRWTATSKFPLIDEDGTLVGTYGITNDITESKNSFIELERIKNQMEAILNSVPNMIFVKDADGKYVMANNAANAYLCPNSTAVGKTDIDLGIPEKEAREYLFVEQQVLRTNKAQFFPEIRSQKPDGTECWFQYIKVPINKTEYHEPAVLSVVTDVSERIHHEIELMESMQVISRQNERLSNFAHIVSHNLRNHAGGISTTLDLLDMTIEVEERNEIIEILRKASDRLNETIMDLNVIMDKQHKEGAELKPLIFQEYLENIKEVLTTELVDKKVRIVEEIEPNLELLYNPAYLESILINLISNAIKYRHPERNPEIYIKAYNEQGIVHLKVADNGLGIDLNSHGDKLFGMYKTFHRNKNAKGIGLYITRNQIESLGGKVSVESEVGKGSTFSINFGKQVRTPESVLQ